MSAHIPILPQYTIPYLFYPSTHGLSSNFPVLCKFSPFPIHKFRFIAPFNWRTTHASLWWGRWHEVPEGEKNKNYQQFSLPQSASLTAPSSEGALLVHPPNRTINRNLTFIRYHARIYLYEEASIAFLEGLRMKWKEMTAPYRIPSCDFYDFLCYLYVPVCVWNRRMDRCCCSLGNRLDHFRFFNRHRAYIGGHHWAEKEPGFWHPLDFLWFS